MLLSMSNSPRTARVIKELHTLHLQQHEERNIWRSQLELLKKDLEVTAPATMTIGTTGTTDSSFQARIIFLEQELRAEKSLRATLQVDLENEKLARISAESDLLAEKTSRLSLQELYHSECEKSRVREANLRRDLENQRQKTANILSMSRVLIKSLETGKI